MEMVITPRLLSAEFNGKIIDFRPELFGAAEGVVEGRFAKKDAEFFAAVAARDVFFAEVFSQELSECAQEGVPAFVAEGVVEGLEVVEIHHG
jgi:hypothetical protein